MSRDQLTLVEFLEEWHPGSLGLTSGTFRPVHMERTAEEVRRQLGDRIATPPTAEELEQTLESIRGCWESQSSLEGMPARDLRRTPWVLFYPRQPVGHWLAEDAKFVRAWLRWLEEARNARAIAALMREFLSAYPQGLRVFEELRAALRKHLADARNLRLARWKESSERVGLLEDNGPSRLVELWWGDELTVEEHLENAGLVGLEASAFVEKASERILELTESSLRRGAGDLDLDRSLQWLEIDGRLRFESLRVETATALLRPFLERTPRPAVQEPIRRFLGRTIGDPRVRRHAWQGVPEDIRHVLFRWLVPVALEEFFRVFDDTAWREHWIYRKAFWSAYLDKEAITDAWVVLGSDALERVRKGTDIDGVGAASLQRGDGTQKSHSVLLMRIGDLTIAEWSHNGTCRIWRDGVRHAPKLYGSTYSRIELTDDPSFSQPHTNAVRGGWQRKIARFIRDETGIQVDQVEFMPKEVRRR